jgi:hypothetical protein
LEHSTLPAISVNYFGCDALAIGCHCYCSFEGNHSPYVSARNIDEGYIRLKRPTSNVGEQLGSHYAFSSVPASHRKSVATLAIGDVTIFSSLDLPSQIVLIVFAGYDRIFLGR